MKTYSDLMQEARYLHRKGRFNEAKQVVDHLVEEDAEGAYGLVARYLRARGYEDGRFSSGVRHDLAYEDYAFLSGRAAVFGSGGLVGQARILAQEGVDEHSREIADLCRRAIELDKNPKAMMLLGFVQERAFENFDEAGRWYIAAFRSGLPWGMRYYARMHWNIGHYVLGLSAHLLATIASPLMVARGGVRSAFK